MADPLAKTPTRIAVSGNREGLPAAMTVVWPPQGESDFLTRLQRALRQAVTAGQRVAGYRRCAVAPDRLLREAEYQERRHQQEEQAR